MPKLLLLALPIPYLVETARKLNEEIAGANTAMVLGLTMFSIAIIIAYCSAHLPGRRQGSKELMLVLFACSLWLIARQTLVIANAGSWIHQAELIMMAGDAQTGSYNIVGWEVYKPGLMFRKFMLPTSTILTFSFVWYIALRYKYKYPKRQKFMKWALRLAIGGGVLAIILVNFLSST